jgi:hypothetical protein
MQDFANRFFADCQVNGWCPKLDALVVGHLTHLPVATYGLDILPHCYIRDERQDTLERAFTVGAQVSRSYLRQTQPYTDILEYDPAISGHR